MLQMERQATLAFKQQIERDMFGNLRLIGDGRRGPPVARDRLADAERRLTDCKAILFNA
ncbi:hypothetical protein [Flavisphingomonas formosensis]|uniref:hypothetical protein n=1 Tax=Flavisphingomonas formosensis TaxID=861534 RepID=UPI0012F91A54|nr:hypothetical protein [Sphingomonas formosensis]